MSDHKLIESLRSGDQQIYRQLFTNYFGMVRHLVVNNLGTEEDARDVFQDTIVVIIEKSREADFTLSASIKTFIYSIARNIWYSRARKRKDLRRLTDFENYLEDDTTEVKGKLKQEEDYSKMERCLKQMGDPCKTILHHYYYLKRSMSDIAQTLGYGNANHAKSQKYKCMKKLKSLVLGESK